MAELPGAAAQSPQLSVGDAFGWAARDPEWIGKVLLMGLIGLIPIVGGLQQVGWLLTMLDNLRAGRYEVPPAAFRYATRGVWLWLAGVIYTVIVLIVVYGTLLVFIGVMIAINPPHSQGESSSASSLNLLFFPLFLLLFGVIGILTIAAWIFVPAIIQFTDRTGFGGAFNIPGFLRAIRLAPQHNLAAAGLALVAYIIAGLGTYVCWVGVIFTQPYALTVLAGVLRWYELNVKPGALPAKVA